MTISLFTGGAGVVCGYALCQMFLLIKHRRWKATREGLRVWRHSPVSLLSGIGRFDEPGRLAGGTGIIPGSFDTASGRSFATGMASA
jgi:hypothetical protein